MSPESEAEEALRALEKDGVTIKRGAAAKASLSSRAAYMESEPSEIPATADETRQGNEPIELPPQLRREDLAFIRVAQSHKKAMDTGWTTSEHFEHGSVRIITRLGDGLNYGLFPRAGSSVVIVDADDLGRLEAVGALAGFPPTFAVESGSSTAEHPKRHLYVTMAEPPFEGKRPFFDRETGAHLGEVYCGHPTSPAGYVIGPGSRHAVSKRPYVPNDEPIRELEPDGWTAFAEAVQWPERSPERPPAKRTEGRGGSFGELLGLDITDVWQIPHGAIKVGNDWRFGHPAPGHGSSTGYNLAVDPLAGLWHCWRCNSGGDALLALAVDAGILRCDEARSGALEDAELMRRVKDEARQRGLPVDEAERQQRQAWLKQRAAARAAAEEETPAPTATAPRPAARRARDPIPPEFERFVYVGERGAVRVDDDALAEFLYERYHTVSFNERLFTYQDGIYREDKGALSAEVKRILRGCGTHEQLTKVWREVKAHLLALHPYERYPFNAARDLIPCENCVLRIDFGNGTISPEPHSPAHRFAFKLPVTFDPDATPEAATALLAQYVEPEDVPLLIQPLAQALLQAELDKPFKKSYLFEGRTNAGKSSVIMIYDGFFGRENISHVSLHAIATDRFCNSRMEGKLLNVYDDLSDVPLEQIGTFKNLTGSTAHSIEAKFQQAYEGRVFCVQLYTCNKPPRVPAVAETDMAWWERWEYVRFTGAFPIDPDFYERTLTPAFYSSLLRAVLDTMIEIRQRGALTVNRTALEVRERWSLMADPLYRFIDAKMERLQATISDFDKGKLWRAYLEWCEAEQVDMSHRLTSLTAFTQALPRYGIIELRTSKARPGKKPASYDVYRGGYRWKNRSVNMGVELAFEDE